MSVSPVLDVLCRGFAYTNASGKRYLANCYARETGKPRAVRKSPEQIKILEEFFEKEQCPYPGDMMLLAYETKLDPIKLRQWFGNQKSKLYKQGWEYDGPNIFEPNPRNAKNMWNEYKKNPRQYAKDLWDTKVCRLTGRRMEAPTLSLWRSPTAWNAKFGSDGNEDEEERWQWYRTRPRRAAPGLIISWLAQRAAVEIMTSKHDSLNSKQAFLLHQAHLSTCYIGTVKLQPVFACWSYLTDHCLGLASMHCGALVVSHLPFLLFLVFSVARIPTFLFVNC